MGKTYGTLEGGREMVLTFDDGPHTRHTPRLLDALATAGVQAVFFVLGKSVKAQGGREIVRRAYEAGHRIGNHTFSHPDLTKLNESQIRRELLDTEELIRDFLTGHKLFRPPYGAHNSTVDRIVSELGYHTVLWSVDPEDWKPTNKPAKWIKQAIDRISSRGHSVVLCHDIHASTVDNISEFIRQAKAVPRARFVAYT